MICDTGSTDNTQKRIRELLKGIPGRIHDDAWVNFGHNRSLGLERAKSKADYHLLIDADIPQRPFRFPPECVDRGRL